MATLGWLGWRSIWAPPKGGEAATVPCMSYRPTDSGIYPYLVFVSPPSTSVHVPSGVQRVVLSSPLQTQSCAPPRLLLLQTFYAYESSLAQYRIVVRKVSRLS